MTIKNASSHLKNLIVGQYSVNGYGSEFYTGVETGTHEDGLARELKFHVWNANLFVVKTLLSN